MFGHVRRWRPFVTSEFHLFLLDALEAIMTTQADIDGRTDAVNTAVVKIVAAVGAIKAELAAGATAPDLDLSQLDAAVASLNDATASAAALVPAPVEDAPVDPSAPVA